MLRPLPWRGLFGSRWTVPAGMMELADIDASKASARKGVRVRVPLPAHNIRRALMPCLGSIQAWIVSASRDNKTMYPCSTADVALLLSGLDVLDRENAQICGVSIRAIRHWRYGTRRVPWAPGKQREPRCPRCDGRALDERAYAYLLGLYLGGGHITRSRRDGYALSLTCCDGWPGLIDAAKTAMAAVMPASSVYRVQRVGCTEVKSMSRHWPCLFPQHGPGRKQAPAPHRTGRLAAANRCHFPWPFCPGAVPFGRLPCHESDPPDAGHRRPLVRISALLLLQRVCGHPGVVRAGAGPARGQLAVFPA